MQLTNPAFSVEEDNYLILDIEAFKQIIGRRIKRGKPWLPQETKLGRLDTIRQGAMVVDAHSEFSVKHIDSQFQPGGNTDWLPGRTATFSLTN